MQIVRPALVSSLLACFIAACGAPAPPATPATTPPTADAPAPTATAAPAPAASAPAPEPAPADPASGGLSPDDFLAQVPPQLCTFLSQCKNEEVTTLVIFPIVFGAAFGADGDPKLSAELRKATAVHEKAGRLPTKDECVAEGPVMLKANGVTPESLKASIAARSIRYDGKQAAACLAAIPAPLDQCTQVKKVSKKANLAALDKIAKAIGAPIGEHFKPCETVVVGLLKAGDACKQDYECASTKAAPLSCRPATEGSGRTCAK